jgi:DNA-binding NarL/FixJ family response regulator
MQSGDMAGVLRVLIVDDHEMFSEALALFFGLQPDIELVGALPAGEEAVARCRDEAPDVVLMDVDLPDMDGIEVTRRIRATSPGTRVVVLSAMRSRTLIVSAMAAGASGYVPKTRAAEDLVDVVRRAAAGEIVMGDDDLPVVLDELRTGREPSVAAELALRRLTARETEILRAVAAGDAATEIAQALGISSFTVQSHIKNILAKLGVHSKIEAVTMAWRHGLTPTSRQT